MVGFPASHISFLEGTLPETKQQVRTWKWMAKEDEGPEDPFWGFGQFSESNYLLPSGKQT